MSASVQPAPCIACGMQPSRAFGDHGDEVTHLTPYAATMFDAGTGHYGSTVWDESSPYRSLRINVCDKCFTDRKDRVVVVDRKPRPVEITVSTWEGPWSGDWEGDWEEVGE